MAIFSKFFSDVIILIIRVNADKRIKKNSDIFPIKNLEYTFVCFLNMQSLCPKNFVTSKLEFKASSSSCPSWSSIGGKIRGRELDLKLIKKLLVIM